jgi:hypothetical protein
MIIDNYVLPGSQEIESEFLSQSEWVTFDEMVKVLSKCTISQDPKEIPFRKTGTIWFEEIDNVNESSVIEYRSFHPVAEIDERYMLKAYMESQK